MLIHRRSGGRRVPSRNRIDDGNVLLIHLDETAKILESRRSDESCGITKCCRSPCGSRVPREIQNESVEFLVVEHELGSSSAMAAFRSASATAFSSAICSSVARAAALRAAGISSATRTAEYLSQVLRTGKL